MNRSLPRFKIDGRDGPNGLVYDRKRTFHSIIFQDKNEGKYQRLAAIVHTGYLGLKAYYGRSILDRID